jgi:hypothetical protein
MVTFLASQIHRPPGSVPVYLSMCVPLSSHILAAHSFTQYMLFGIAARMGPYLLSRMRVRILQIACPCVCACESLGRRYVCVLCFRSSLYPSRAGGTDGPTMLISSLDNFADGGTDLGVN